MTVKKKNSTRKPNKPTCEIGNMRCCNGFAIRRYKGPKKGDPTFHACLPCMNDLRRAGLRGVKEVQ
jgi:hypothetical protein